MVETYCSKVNVQLKAGTSAVTLTDDQYTKLINQAENLINARMRKSFFSTYSGLSDSFKLLLNDACSSRAAYMAIAYDQTGYTSGQVTNLLNVNVTIFNEAMAELKNQDVVTNIEDS